MRGDHRTIIVLITGMEDITIPTQLSGNDNESKLLEYVLNSVWTVADQIFLIFNHAPDLKLIEDIAPFGVKIILRPNDDSVLAAMSTGIEASKSEMCCVILGNSPFIVPNLLFKLFQSAIGYDAAIPRWLDGRIEPLFAVYRRKAFLRAAGINKEAATPYDIVNGLYAIRYIDIEKELKRLDPDLNSFFRINGDNDISKARNIAANIMRRYRF